MLLSKHDTEKLQKLRHHYGRGKTYFGWDFREEESPKKCIIKQANFHLSKHHKPQGSTLDPTLFNLLVFVNGLKRDWAEVTKTAPDNFVDGWIQEDLRQKDDWPVQNSSAETLGERWEFQMPSKVVHYGVSALASALQHAPPIPVKGISQSVLLKCCTAHLYGRMCPVSLVQNAIIAPLQQSNISPAHLPLPHGSQCGFMLGGPPLHFTRIYTGLLGAP